MNNLLKKALAALVAAVTSPEAIAEEKSFAIFVSSRVLLACGASYAVVELVSRIIGAA